jgi:voltage-gated potassium channel
MQKEQKVTGYELFMVALSVYVLLALSAERIFTLAPYTSAILNWMDTAVCVVFAADFVVQLVRAPSKLRYLRWGWIDLLSSIPMIAVFRWGRLLRIVRVLRLLRGVRAAKILVAVVFARRARGALATALFLALVLATFGSIAVLHLETDPQSNIRTPSEALYWSLATLTTVGYGDLYPVTAEGRAVGIVMMIAGVCLFGIFTGLLVTWFTQPIEAPLESLMTKLADEVSALRGEIRQLKAELATARTASAAGSE